MNYLIAVQLCNEKLSLMFKGEQQWMGKGFFKVRRDLRPIKFKQVCLGAGFIMSSINSSVSICSSPKSLKD